MVAFALRCRFYSDIVCKVNVVINKLKDVLKFERLRTEYSKLANSSIQTAWGSYNHIGLLQARVTEVGVFGRNFLACGL